MQVLEGRTEQEVEQIRTAMDQLLTVLSRSEKAVLKELSTGDCGINDLTQRLHLSGCKDLAADTVVDVLDALRSKVATFFTGPKASFFEIRFRIVGSITRARDAAYLSGGHVANGSQTKSRAHFRLEAYRLRILEGRSSEERDQILRVLSKVDFSEAERFIFEEINAVPLVIIEDPGASSKGPVGRIAENAADRGYSGKVEAVRTAISKMRSKLEDFSKGPVGLFEDIRIQLLKNTRGDEHFLFSVNRNVPPPGASAFWANHMGIGKPVTIIIGQPVFFQDSSGFLVRDYLMDAQEGWRWARKLLQRLRPDLREDLLGEIAKVTSFAPLQDFRAMLSILRYFDDWHRKGHPKPQFLAAREPFGKDEASNIVLIGSPFENPHIWQMECNWFDLQMEESDRVEGVTSVPTMEETWAEQRTKHEATWERKNAKWYGGLIAEKLGADEGGSVVSIIRETNPGQCVTVIESLDAVALEVVCDVLTDENEMKRVVDCFGLATNWEGFPACFEMSFVVHAPGQPGEVAFAVQPECWGPRITHMTKTIDPLIVPGR